MFHGNEAGAQTSCMLFTLIETAKLTGWEPHAYLIAVLRRLPLIRETAG